MSDNFNHPDLPPDFEEKYEKWRAVHGKAFGKTFLSAFDGNHSAQVRLTSALILTSRREFEKARPMYETLIGDCVSAFDFAVLDFFRGMNYEFAGNEAEMCYHYEKLLNSRVKLEFNLLFHPYFRTAKFAQRSSECKKALHYYGKALEFYSDSTPKGIDAENVSGILFEMATVYLYSHNYDEAEKYANLSEKFSKKENQNRNFFKCVLSAIKGDKEKSYSSPENLPGILKKNGKITIDSIINKINPHYFVVPQQRFAFVDFVRVLRSEEQNILNSTEGENKSQAEEKISKMLTLAFPFTKRKLECRIEKIQGETVFLCKNYCIKTLDAEYKALFEIIDEQDFSIRFLSVDAFELDY